MYVLKVRLSDRTLAALSDGKKVVKNDEFTFELSDRLFGSTIDLDPAAKSGNFALLKSLHLILSWREEIHVDFCNKHEFVEGDVLLRGTMTELADIDGHGHIDIQFFDCPHPTDNLPGEHELEFLKYLIATDFRDLGFDLERLRSQ